MSHRPEYVFCGDDFTGASDTLATLARAGLRSRLFLSPSAVKECGDLSQLDAVGIATATRSMMPPAITAELTQTGKALADLGAKVFHYKVCSTFDSSPETGSIGSAVNALKKVMPDAGVIIIGGQPSLRRYCIFSNLFAAAIDDQIYRIDSHPTMANHPVTPMNEADLRALLAAQGLQPVTGLHLPLYPGGIDSLRVAVHRLLTDNNTVLFDALHQSDLTLIGQLLHEQLSRSLVIGSSSVAEAYVSGFLSKSTTLSPHVPSKPEKPVFVLAGSRSQATANQVEKAKGFTQLMIHPADIERDSSDILAKLSAKCLALLSQGNNILAIVSNDMNHSLSRVALAQFTANLVAKVALSGQIGRLGIAGGDTSSFALQTLGVESLSHVTDIEPGICLCRLHSENKSAINGLEVALKGGQMGSPELFTKLAGQL